MKRAIWIMISVVLVVVVLVIGYLLWISNTNSGRLAAFSAQFPTLQNAPIQRELSPESVAPGQYTEYSYYGVNFKAPWTNPSSTGQRPGIGTQIWFPDNKFVTVFEDDYAFNEFIEPSLENNSSTITAFFGSNIWNDKYQLLQTILSNTPAQVTAATNTEEVNARYALMQVKSSITVPDINEPIYSFATQNLKGFQIGNGDALAKTPAAVYIFNSSGTLYAFSISGNQNEIDYIISSIQFTN